MEVRAVAKYVKGGSQKARLVVDLIRGKRVEEALSILALSNKAASKSVTKVLKSAVANAENNKDLDVDKLYVKSVFVDQGPSQKRMRPRAMGRANVIKKRTKHITIIVDEQPERR